MSLFIIEKKNIKFWFRALTFMVRALISNMLLCSCLNEYILHNLKKTNRNSTILLRLDFFWNQLCLTFRFSPDFEFFNKTRKLFRPSAKLRNRPSEKVCITFAWLWKMKFDEVPGRKWPPMQRKNLYILCQIDPSWKI